MKIYLPCSLLLTLAVICFSFTANANDQLEQDAGSHFLQGQKLYNREDYIAALPAFMRAVELSPMSSDYHHMLGKCYGRIAEEGSWLTALRYIGKTLAEFKKAVALDDKNIQALLDLEEFYLRAPGFLGGSKSKAAEIRTQLEKPGPGLETQR